MGKSAGYVSADYLREAADRGRRLKERTYELMEIGPGAKVLDVGCGPGVDTVALTDWVGSEGRVVGVDIDADMLKEADITAREAEVMGQVSHIFGDVDRLPFEDGYFQAARAERLLQVLPAPFEPLTVIHEMQRVIEPGGRLVVADTDWGSASVDMSDAELERRLMSFFARTIRPNGFAGRQLYRLFQQAGLRDIDVEVHPFVMLKWAETPFGDWLHTEASKAGVTTDDALDRWREVLAAQDAIGEFFACVNMVVVSGERAG